MNPYFVNKVYLKASDAVSACGSYFRNTRPEDRNPIQAERVRGMFDAYLSVTSALKDANGNEGDLDLLNAMIDQINRWQVEALARQESNAEFAAEARMEAEVG